MRSKMFLEIFYIFVCNTDFFFVISDCNDFIIFKEIHIFLTKFR